MPWRQYRSVEAGPVSLDGLDIDVRVRKPKEDPLEFDVRVWNLTRSTWERIEDGDLVRIELGWVDGDSAVVCLGPISNTIPSADGNDVEYRLKGVDESEAATGVLPGPDWSQKSWKNRDPAQIAAALAEQVGLSPVVENVGQRINGVWAVTPDQKVRAWLDELLDYAAEFTGQKWEWFATRGRLHFVPQSQDTVSAPELAYGATLVSINEKSSSDENVEQELEFEAMLDPRIQKGALVHVATDEIEGAYRVNEYEFRSSTQNGDHLVQGTLMPIEGDYSVVDPHEEFSVARLGAL